MSMINGKIQMPDKKKLNKKYFTVGPTELFPQVKNYIKEALENNICSLYHRSDEFINLYNTAGNNLKKLFKIPDEFQFFFLGSATECMDRIIQNLVIKNSFHFINGAFGQRFCNTAKELNKKPVSAKVNYGESFNFKKIIIPENSELICITQNETSTGVSISEKKIKELNINNPGKLLAVDIVSSVPYVKLDYKYIDCAFFSVQKGFGLPAGLAVLLVNNKCLEKTKSIIRKKSGSIGSYHNFIKLYQNAQKSQTTETPNTLGIFLLAKITKYLLDYGIEEIRKETEIKSEILYDFFDSCNFANPFVINSSDRSKTVITIQTHYKDKIKRRLKENNIIVSDGYGILKERQLRIGNFPMHKIDDVKTLINVLQKKSIK